jgi:hypothetical protein
MTPQESKLTFALLLDHANPLGPVGIRVAQVHCQPAARPDGQVCSVRSTLSALDWFRPEVDAVDPAAIRMREVPRRPADAPANIEIATVLSNRDPLSLIARGGRATRMQMLKRARISGFEFCGSCPDSGSAAAIRSARQVASNALEHPLVQPWRLASTKV